MVFTKEWYGGNEHPMKGRKHGMLSRVEMHVIRSDGRYSGKNNGFYGKNFSAEYRKTRSELLSKKFQGESNPFFSKTHSSEQRLKWSRERRGPSNPRWKDGSSQILYGVGWGNKFKDDVRDSFGRICVLSLEPENGIKLSVHHIDGNKDNHSLDNLIPLQYWVHSMIHANEEFFEGTPYWKPDS